ncbi:MAG: hypothetical protein ACSHX4_04080 [Opitutaceae bacterium]
MKQNTVYEVDAATQLGVGRKVLVDLRLRLPLVKGEHWRYGQNKKVYYKPAGLVLLLEALEIPPENPPSETAKITPLPSITAQAVIIRAVVAHVPGNTKILECRSKEAEGVIVVRVQDNRKWVPGMKLTVRKAMEIPSLWYLEGRSPRRKGQM